MPEKKFILWGAILGGLAVAIGAWGAHGGAHLLNAKTLITFQKAVKYQMFHAIALLITGLLIIQWKEQTRYLNIAGWSFLTGTVLFSGSLYFIAFLSVKAGYITPAGGIAFIVGWISLVIAAFKRGND